MKVYAGIDQFTPPSAGITLTIGNFDGVHLGHQRILKRAREVAGSLGTPVVVLTFEPHPLAVLTPQRAPARLTTLPEKLHLLRASGVDVCIVQRSEPALLSQSAAEFLRELVHSCRPRALIEGPDFNFGRGRGGSTQTLRDFAARLEFAVHVIDIARCEELPGRPSMHSAAIREALRAGRVDVAQAMLGRPYRIVGRVTGGAGRGRRLGFPTANLGEIPHQLPQPGIYAAVAQLENQEMRLAATNLGPQPTFGEGTPRVEAHLLDWNGVLADQMLGLHFLARLRDQQRFKDAQELAAQIRRDVEATRRYEPLVAQLREFPAVPVKHEPGTGWD